MLFADTPYAIAAYDSYAAIAACYAMISAITLLIRITLLPCCCYAALRLRRHLRAMPLAAADLFCLRCLYAAFFSLLPLSPCLLPCALAACYAFTLIPAFELIHIQPRRHTDAIYHTRYITLIYLATIRHCTVAIMS